MASSVPAVDPAMGDDFMFGFERDFDYLATRSYMAATWHRAAWYCACYALCVWAGRRYMESRPALSLRAPLALWSAVLAVFSIVGTIRTLPHMVGLLTQRGVYPTVCEADFLSNPPTAVWAYVFAVSKLYELGDTAFIVLRKQKLSFLHFYHHMTVLLYCWYSYKAVPGSSSGLVFLSVNFLVHSLMYSYYTLKAMKVSIPRGVAMAITLLQTVQMVVGVSVTVLIARYKRAGRQCAEDDELIYWAAAMYASYLVLFANFFYQSYLRPRPATHKQPVANGNSHSQANGSLKQD